MSPLELQHRVEQFYYREARMLDSREYQQWLALVTESIRYVMPARVNQFVDNRKQGQEQMIAIEHELEGVDSDGCPLREEGYANLFVRVDRAYKINSWAENPPARTRRIIGNVEVMSEEEGVLKVTSNFHLFFARPGSANYIYSGQRNDQLLVEGESYRIDYREVVMDYADIEYPTMGLLF